ncbi:MAG TPA: hypothetical protein VK615_05280 [Candidatus Binatia bacterium]|nr:hypothetical protein [Candidatus Binatia bacterium]
MTQRWQRAAVCLAAILIVGVAAWYTLRIPYHKWRMAACVASAERLRNGQNTRTDELLSLIRGEPQTYQDYQAAATRHENALIDLKYLARKEFHLRTPVSTGEAMDRFMKLALVRFPNRREWSCVFSSSGDSIVVTTRPKRLPQWEEFIRAYDADKPPEKVLKCNSRARRLDAIRMSRF